MTKGVTGEALQGAWSWKEADVVATTGNSGHVAVFTPDDTVHYETVEKTISVNVLKATPVVKTAPTATTVTYGDVLGASVLIGGVVCHSEKDETEIAGKFMWKNPDKKPYLLDSDNTEYDVVFTPTDGDNYNSVEIKLTITVRKAAAPSVKPSDTITVSYDTETAGVVKLPWGWIWTEADTTKVLPTVGKTYQDDSGKALYIVTSNDKRTVTYKKPTDKRITTVTIPATVTINGIIYKVTAIQKNAFRGCKKLKTVKIGKNVKDIGKQVFYGCGNLKSVFLGKKTVKIGKKAFYGCKSLETLTVQSMKLTKKNVGSKSFGKTPENMTVKVPKKKFKAYKKLLVKKGVSKKAKFQKKAIIAGCPS